MEKRLAALEGVLCSAEPAPETEPSYADLTADEQIDLYLLLERLGEHQRFWNPGPPLTPEEEARMHALLDRGVLAPRGTRVATSRFGER